MKCHKTLVPMAVSFSFNSCNSMPLSLNHPRLPLFFLFPSDVQVKARILYSILSWSVPQESYLCTVCLTNQISWHGSSLSNFYIVYLISQGIKPHLSSADVSVGETLASVWLSSVLPMDFIFQFVLHALSGKHLIAKCLCVV